MTNKRINDETILDMSGIAPFLRFDALSRIPFILHGFSTKLGGVSGGCFESMNLGFDRGDDNGNVMENYKRIAAGIGFEAEKLVFTDQWHTTNVREATGSDCGKGIFRERDYEAIDGHITDEPGVVLLVFGADCTPIYLVDTKRQAIGLCHSGWKGTANRIAQVTIESMSRRFNTDPKDITAVIGPSICHSCYEIGEDVAGVFRNNFKAEINSCDSILTPGRADGKYQLNLWEANRAVLALAGVRAENIHACGICTMENTELMFSHRRDGDKRGSMAAFLSIKEQ